MGKWGRGEPKWRCCAVVVETIRPLLTASHTPILDIRRVIEKVMLWMGLWVHPYTVIPVHLGGTNLGISGYP